jgi:hypothetical protein
MMFINRFIDFGRDAIPREPPLDPKIELTYFVDPEHDLAGWYSLGHHDPAEFFAAVTAREPDSLFSIDRVQLAWAKFGNHRFKLCHLPDAGYQPITYVEAWD